MLQLHLNAVPLFIVAGISFSVCLTAFFRRYNNPAAGILSLLMFTTTLWTLFYILELSAVSERAQFFANDIAYIPIVTVPVLLLLFILSATGYTNFITVRRVSLLFIIPVLNLILIWSSNYHHLFYSWIEYIPDGSRNVMSVGRGAFYWVNIVYSYLCLFISTIFAFSSFIKTGGIFRTQAAMLAAGAILPWIGSLLNIVYGNIGYIHTVQLSFSICGLIFLAGVIKFRFFNISPIGRHVIIDKMRELVLAVNQNDIVIDLNPALLKMLHKNRAEVLGKHVSEVFTGWENEINLLDGMSNDTIEITVKDNNEMMFFDVSKTKLSTTIGGTLGTLFLMNDATERVKTELKLKEQLDQIKALEKKLREQAIRDPLTGLYNRRFLEEVLHQHFARVRRGTGTIGLLFIDIDDFKKLNDTYGHPTGDAVLCSLSEILQSHTRESDVVCRYGGEEFLIVFIDTDSEEIKRRAEIIRKVFEASPVFCEDQLKTVTFSAGIALCPENGNTVQETIKFADEALYRAKSAGKNRVEISKSTTSSI